MQKNQELYENNYDKDHFVMYHCSIKSNSTVFACALKCVTANSKPLLAREEIKRTDHQRAPPPKKPSSLFTSTFHHHTNAP